MKRARTISRGLSLWNLTIGSSRMPITTMLAIGTTTTKGQTTTIGEGLTWIILVVAVVVETAVILAVPYGVQTVVASAWEETL